VKALDPVLRSVSENALTISFGDSIDPETNKRVFQLYNRLLKNRHTSWRDVIPAYSTVTIVYDVLTIRQTHTAAFQCVRDQVEKIISETQPEENISNRHVRVPVCYDESFAWDGERVAKEKKISIRELAAIHASKLYHVFMIGFLPGFPYMGSVDARIGMPRIATPRTLVPTGSVGIAGEQTGIYPLDSPGGWNIIGKTPLKIFDLCASSPVLIQPGDQVRFIPITKEQFESFDASTFKFVVNES